MYRDRLGQGFNVNAGSAMLRDMRAVETLQDENARVDYWCHDRFRELGCDEAQAARLVYAGVDWHRYAALIAAGCPLDRAEAILS